MGSKIGLRIIKRVVISTDLIFSGLFPMISDVIDAMARGAIAMIEIEIIIPSVNTFLFILLYAILG
jgi:hypothetical protein